MFKTPNFFTNGPQKWATFVNDYGYHDLNLNSALIYCALHPLCFACLIVPDSPYTRN